MNRSIRIKLRLLVSLFLSLVLVACKGNREVEIVIVHTNDTHSQIDPVIIDNQPFGGVVERASILEMMRQKEPELLYIDAGDMIQGSPYFNIWNGEIEIKAMNLQGVMMSTFGNHEFDNGIDGLARMLGMADFPIISCNYIVKDTQLEKFVKPSIIVERKGVKIGFTGVTANPEGLIFARNWEGIRFIDPSEAANAEARKLREAGCDLVVLISHAGYYDDTIGDRYIAANSTDIDLIIGGHSHTNLETGEVVNNLDGKPVIITQTGGKNKAMGLVNVRMHRSQDSKVFVADTIICSKIHPDSLDLKGYGSSMDELVAPYRNSLQEKMNERLATAVCDLPRFRPQSPLGNFASDALRSAARRNYDKEVDVALLNIGGIRNDLYAGDITVGDTYRIFPFENSLTILELKGSDLEEAIHQVEHKKLEAFSGTEITLRTIGGRHVATDIRVGGKPIDPKRTYVLATVDYLAEGNDGLTALTKATKTTDTGILVRDLISDHLKELDAAGKVVDVKLDGRVTDLSE